MGNHLIRPDFLTPKKKSSDTTKDSNIHEYTANEFDELAERVKEIRHYETEARNSAKKLSLNSRNENQVSTVPDWALLSIAAMPRKTK